MGVNKTFLTFTELRGKNTPPMCETERNFRGGSEREIVEFLGVAGEVEKLLRTGATVPDVFFATVGEPLHGTVEDGVFSMEPWSERFSAPSQHVSEEADAIETMRRGEPGTIEQGGKEIAHFHDGMAYGTTGGRNSARRFDNERHPGRAFIGVAFAKQVVISHHLAMIRGENDP